MKTHTKKQAYEQRRASTKAFRKSSHIFNKKFFHWFYCSGCGLVTLKNESTRKRMEQPCDSMED